MLTFQFPLNTNKNNKILEILGKILEKIGIKKRVQPHYRHPLRIVQSFDCGPNALS